MAQQEGPFSEYLQMAKMTPQVQVPQPTGLEGAGSAIGNIAMNFINGLRQGRMQKYAMQQMEEQKKFDAYQDTLQKVRASRLPQAEKVRLEAQLTMPLVQRIAGDKEASSKATGNPLTDVLKNMAVGLVGGNIPKKGADLPMDPIVEALRMVSDPEKSVDRLASAIDSKALARVAQLNKESLSRGKRLTFDQIESDPEYRGYLQEARQLGVPLPSERLISAKYPVMGATEQAAQKQAEAAARYTEGVTTPVQAAVTKTAAPPSVATNFVPLPEDVLNQDKLIAVQAGPAYSQLEVRGEPKQYKDENTGEVFQGFQVKGKSASGVYRPDKQGYYRSGYRELTTAELAKPPQAQVDRVYQVTRDGLKNRVRPKIFNDFSGMLDSLREQGDVKSMENVLGMALQAERDERNYEERRQDALERGQLSSDAKKSNVIGSIERRIQQNPKVKDFNTVYSYSDQALDAANAAKATGNSSMADILLVRALAKLTDMNTGVKESEYMTFTNAVSKVGQLGVKVSNLLEAKGETLDNKTRDEIIRLINVRRERAAKEYNAAINQYRAQGRSSKLTDDEMSEMFPNPVPVPSTGDKPTYTPRGAGAKGASGFSDLGFTPR